MIRAEDRPRRSGRSELDDRPPVYTHEARGRGAHLLPGIVVLEVAREAIDEEASSVAACHGLLEQTDRHLRRHDLALRDVVV